MATVLLSARTVGRGAGRGSRTGAVLRDYLEACVRRHGANSTSYVLLEGDKSVFVAPEIDGFVAFEQRAGVTVIGGDPVCAPEDAQALVAAFVATSAAHGRGVCAYQVTPELLPAFRACGFSDIQIGAEAVVDLHRFSLAGQKMLNVRAATHRAARGGVVVAEHFPLGRGAATEALNRELADVSAEWLRAKGDDELGFLLGGLGLDTPSSKRYFVARGREGTGRVEAFIVCEPVFARDGYYLDVTRRRADAVPGTMELLTAEICARLKAEGRAMVSLGMAPLARLDDPDLARHPRCRRAMEWAFAHFEPVYGFEGLYRYKAKFHPHAWERRYLCFRGSRLGPRVAYAAVMVRRREGLLSMFGARLSRRLHALVGSAA